MHVVQAMRSAASVIVTVGEEPVHQGWHVIPDIHPPQNTKVCSGWPAAARKYQHMQHTARHAITAAEHLKFQPQQLCNAPGRCACCDASSVDALPLLSLLLCSQNLDDCLSKLQAMLDAGVEAVTPKEVDPETVKRVKAA
jgi:hypothetical protein